jgi:hypothetical protein
MKNSNKPAPKVFPQENGRMAIHIVVIVILADSN